ncbi:DUF2550 domain-containing protein [Corynebacterium diphtheriae bv. gravis]|uniref:DUF2550 domain-containing protein n=1 Tax=Corynebacterium diphtheriae TaxID=1717 RepID=UPI0018CB40F9|nr:DUF2550 domain-containing protein [Corynebacterium diphtheriae]MBG9248536.1 DUF2550 domain-containing protein [Corynebacterium diphtheriae bv. gravis]
MKFAIGITLLLLILAVLLAVAAWRFLYVRCSGSAVVIRELPSPSGRHWRHGSMRYNGEGLQYFKLRSLKPGPDLVVDRQQVDYLGARPLEDSEILLLNSDATVHKIKHLARDFEVALDKSASMAFVSWIESAPSRRQERIDYNALYRKVDRNKRK